MSSRHGQARITTAAYSVGGNSDQGIDCPYAALLLRVSLGILFLTHVGLKFFVFFHPRICRLLRIPGFARRSCQSRHCAGIVRRPALILGIYAPLVALPLAAEMLGTIVFVHGANGWMFSNKGGGWEYPAFWTVALIVLYLLGDGAYALRPTQRTNT